jgi:hypothetical protein
MIDMPFDEAFGPDIEVDYQCLNSGTELTLSGLSSGKLLWALAYVPTSATARV